MNIETIAITRINPAPYNPRKDLKPDDIEYQNLVRSMQEYGCVEPLVWNKRTGHLVGGHQRFKVLLAQGVQEATVSVVDLGPAKEKALNLALNKISGDWDTQKLSALLDELLQTPDLDIALTGFQLPEVEGLIADLLAPTTGAEQEPDADASDNRPAITQTGDLIELGLHGEHRLLCGDAAKMADLARLMGEHRARLCHTDPPYGVNYDRSNRPVAKKAATAHDKLQNDDLTPKRYAAWFAKVCDSIAESLVPGGGFYIWNSHKHFGLMHNLLSQRGFKVSAVISWAKESFSPNFSDYNEQVEYCLYGWKGGARHRWYGPKNESTLWQIPRDRVQCYHHPTQKALELAQRALRNSSQRGDIVLDPFLGGGTTLIAAARLGRRCFGLEIEPRYCDRIVRRYIALAGENAVSPEIAQRYRVKEVA